MSMTNITLEQANNLFKTLGVDAAVVSQAEEATQDANIEEIAKTYSEKNTQPVQVEGFTQEEVDRKVSEGVGKLFGTFRTAFAREFGLVASDLNNLEAKDMAAKVKDAVQNRYTHTEKELREQLESANNALNAKDEEFNTKLSEIERKHTIEREQSKIFENVSNSFKSIPNKAKDLGLVADTAFKKWQERYDVRLNPVTGEAQFYEKGTENIAMDGKNPIKTETLAKSFLSDFGLDVSDTSHIAPSDVIANNGNGNNYQAGAISQLGDANNANVSDNFAGLIKELSKEG